MARDWQSTKKSVLERSSHMFNNPLMSDIVLNCEGSDKTIFAHKYVLATSSAVFYAMFYGKLAEKNSTVNLTDTDEESLVEFIRFFYTDKCDLTRDNVVSVLYLAKKYIVPSLSEECVQFLMANLAVENVFTLLQEAIRFEEKELEERSWSLIDWDTKNAVTEEGFYNIDKTSIIHLLNRKHLNINDTDLLEAVSKWSEYECSRKGIEANSKNKIAEIEDVLRQTRFPSTNLQGLNENSSISTLLRCCRFGPKFVDYSIWTCDVLYPSQSRHEIRLSFSHDVKLYGVRLLGKTEKEHDVQLEVCSRTITKKFYSQMNGRGIPGFDVMLPIPIKVQANAVMNIKATFNNSNPYGGFDGLKTVETNGVTITFSDVHSGETTLERGQFDEIIFSKI